MNKQLLAWVAYAAAVVLVVIAVIYFMTPADQLPSYIPGHEAGVTKVHVKHGIAAVVLALGAVAFGWFQSGPKSPKEQ